MGPQAKTGGTHKRSILGRIGVWLKSQTAAVAVIMAGVLILTLPPVFMSVNADQAIQTASSHVDRAKTLKQRERRRILQNANEYNTQLAMEGQTIMGEATDPWNTDGSSVSEQDANYNSQLATPKDGIMAVIDYPKLDISLPVRHGTSKRTLDAGAGHMYGTSLPVGGNGTHAVISAHTGLADQLMFDRLQVGRGAKKGDTFTITVLDRTLVYKVTSIKVVNPDDFDQLTIQPGKDLVTLLTCTPYGINTRRLLVTGTRVTPTPKKTVQSASHAANPILIAWMILPWIAAGLFVFTVQGTIPTGRKGKKHGKHLA